MSRSPQRIKPTSEKKRERDVLQYVAAYRDLPFLDELGPEPDSYHLPAAYQARPSSDSTLTALAQLAALRLNAQRALISLIDDKRQHVLAEATPRLPLRRTPSGDAHNPLWLGSVSIPRTWGVCEQVLGINPGSSAQHPATTVIINKDLLDSKPHAHRTYVRDGPRVRFYAGAALVSPNGAIIGALCVFDSEPKPAGLPDEDITYLEDLSATIVEYLGTYTVRDRFKRGEKLTRGLISFAEGASALLPLDDVDHLDTEDTASMSTETSGTTTTNPDVRSTHGASEKNHHNTSSTGSVGASEQHSSDRKQQFSAGSDTLRARSTRNTSLRALQDTILPMNSRSMFSRAANVMMASSDLDGVLILDASIAATGHRQHPAAPERERLSGGLSDATESGGGRSKSESSEDSSSHNGANNRPNSSSSKRCQVLGSAPSGRPIVNLDGTPGVGALAESGLARMLREYPHGKVFNYTEKGSSMSSTDESSSAASGRKDELLPTREGSSFASNHKHGRASRSSKAISDLLPGARSVAFVPFWDYERSRWFAGCLCWTNSPDRLLSTSVDLAYFNIFSHSIMRELSRLDAVALNQQKTTFVASISHELRSPLHGILGTLEFIKDTPLDTFQTSMLNSLNACGQTLLDTINHVMDHSKMSETTKGVSSRRLKNTRTVRLSSKPLKTRRLRDPAFDLGIATEEVVEAVFAGSSFLPIVSSKNAPVSPTESTSTSAHTEISDPTFKRKTCYIVLDIAPENDWIYCFPVGSWKRTVMNIFGNALKYTSTGHITISLHATDVARSTGFATTITLIVTDTGAGMSPAFLANKAFQPFSQENPHSSGVGLGLSIVRQIIETNGGKIEVSSDHSSGTKLTVKLSLIRPETAQIALPQRNEYLSWLARLVGRKICIMHREDSDQDIIDEPQNAEGLAKFSRALVSTLSNHLKMEVVQTTKWEDNHTDIVICPEPSFDYLASVRHKRVNAKASKAAVTIFVALDALEASTLRSDVRVMNKESVVEIMTQPLGPYKLAYVLNKCLDRFEHPDENVQPVQNLTPSTKPNRTQSTCIEQQTSISPPPVEMPPLLNQPHWSETDVPPPSSPPDTSNVATPTIESTFSKELRLPIRPKLAIPTSAPNDSSNILITDDNVINRRLLVAFMKKYNLKYAEAENGLEALRAYQVAQVPYDVILMDMSMPVMDGMSATRAIRQYEQEYNVPRCCIIALTGLASASAKLEAWNSGIDHFMTKPVNFKALEKFLKKEEARREETTEASREETTEAKP